MTHGLYRNTLQTGLGIFALLAAASLPGCHKKAVVAKTAPAPAPAPMASNNNSGGDRTPSRPAPSETRSAPSSNAGITKADRDTLNQNLAKLDDALFDYNQATIRPDAAKALEANVTVIRTILTRYPQQKVRIEGHADERGSDEYNMALGDKRGEAAKEFLAGMGISSNQLAVVSYGKQRPVCTEHDEDCWQKNRRAHFVAEEDK